MKLELAVICLVLVAGCVTESSPDVQNMGAQPTPVMPDNESKINISDKYSWPFDASTEKETPALRILDIHPGPSDHVFLIHSYGVEVLKVTYAGDIFYHGVNISNNPALPEMITDAFNGISKERCEYYLNESEAES